MNFLCDQCKQKYHVADEKVRGRAVTRFRCKKCNHVIELRMAAGDAEGGASAEAPPSIQDEVSSASIMPPSNPPPPPASSAGRGATVGGTAGARPAAGATRPLTGTALPVAPAARTGGTNAGAAPRPATSSSSPSGASSPTPIARGATSSASPAGGALPSRPGGSATTSASPAGSTAAATAARPAPRPATGTGLPVAPATSSRAIPGAAPGGTSPGARAPTGTGLPTSAARSATGSPLRSGLSSAGGATTSSRPESTRRASSASALLNASETGWYAGVRDLPVGPLTRSELVAKIEAGDITPDSLVWREGLDDWRPLRSVEELGDLVRAAAQKMSDGLLGTMGHKKATASQPAGKVVSIASSRAAAVKPGFESPEPDDDDEPAPQTNDDEPTRMTALADLVAKAEQAGVLSKPPSAPSANRPAPPPAAKPAAKPAPAPAPAPAPRAATVTADPLPLVMPAVSSPAPKPAVTPAASAFTLDDAAPPVAPAKPAAGPALAGPNEPTLNLDSAAASTKGLAGLVPAPTATATASTASTAPVVAPRDDEGTKRDRKPGGLPLGAWIMMAGIGFTGVAVGLLLRPPPAPATGAPATTTRANTTAPTPPVAPTRTTGAEITLPTEPTNAPPPVAPPTQPAANTAANANGGGESAPTRRPGTSASHTGTTAVAAPAPAAPRLTAAQQAALRQLEQTAGVPSSTGPTNSQLANAPQTAAPTGLSGSARAEQVINALQRSGVVGSCWNTVIRRNPAHPPESFTVELDVQPTGRATRITVAGSNDPDLANCIQSRARAQPFGPGGTVTTRASFNLTTGN